MNRDYVMLLFSRSLGKQMMIGAIISQIIGGYVIHRIVSIRV